ncbi:MAG: tyrosine-type recombinase/integrase [bacterium]
MRELNMFKDYLLHEKRYSINTADAYISDISLAECYFNDTGTSLLKVDREFLKNYLASLFHAVTSTTLQRKISALKHFFHFMNKRKLCENNPAVNLISPRKGLKLPQFLTRNEIDRIISFNFSADLKGFRNKALMELIYGSGLRVGEIVKLRRKNVDFEEEEVDILGKGKKERVVPVTSEAISAIEDYLMKRGDFFEPKAFLFLNMRGKPITERGVQYIINRIAIRAGVFRKVSPHMLRHSFASHFLENGMNLRYLQHMLGHSNLSTTQNYTHLGITELQDIYNRTFPDNRKSEV